MSSAASGGDAPNGGLPNGGLPNGGLSNGGLSNGGLSNGGAPNGETPVAVVAGHGDVAAGLVSAVAQITGRGGAFVAVSNRGLGAAEVEAAIRAAAAAPSVVALFTDLPAGSCTIAARRVLRDRPQLALVVGVNLPTLLDFICAMDCAGATPTDPDGARAIVVRAAERGRAGLALVGAPAAPNAAAPTSAGPAGGVATGGPSSEDARGH